MYYQIFIGVTSKYMHRAELNKEDVNELLTYCSLYNHKVTIINYRTVYIKLSN